MSALSFGEPLYLIILAVVIPLAAWGLIVEHRHRKEALRRYGDEKLLDRFARMPARHVRMLRAASRLAVLALVLVALARPELGQRPVSSARTGRDLLVLLDLSRSMNAADAGVSRLDLAKQAALEILAAAPDHRVGLIVFGGSAFLQLPLTGNHAAFRRYLAAASTDDLGDPATDLSRAFDAAATTFDHEGERGYQSVLVLSDGESVSGDIDRALTRLRRSRIPVFAVGIGTAEGAPIPADSSAAPEQWHRDHTGRVVISHLEEGDLRRAARETNGSYERWSTAGPQRLGAQLAKAEQRVLASSETLERVNRFQWPLGLAVITLAFESMLGHRSRRRAR
ncbi:MAG TPA: VWA domain-containing protein [Gemmatimonadales bacterium]|nr:VWA domain-containing protein [Gemmatimonadales bacterium]